MSEEEFPSFSAITYEAVNGMHPSVEIEIAGELLVGVTIYVGGHEFWLCWDDTVGLHEWLGQLKGAPAQTISGTPIVPSRLD